ncbi:MAG: DUF3141 domain-containing protein [Alphaproteobacteria bacterium]|nr:DUF3141 domain-containing protein [Alphaproteobacteria bacterium]
MPPSPFVLAQQAAEYWVDAAQRTVMFVDALRQRSNIHIAHENSETPTVLHFKYEMVMDGRKLAHPVNYHLLRILPPEGVATDPKKRPFIVFDPRAGHGPGIGGMKEDSEIGNTLRLGHPAYFVGFLPAPIPGQTVEHVCEAEKIFIERVIALHPEAEKPALIGNCQAGWQIAMVGATAPESVGVLILAGAPMSFWNGLRGRDYLRYMGGLVGGSWLTAFANDIGNGKFDGASLVYNFERMNPSNTYWKKAHNVYAKIDTEIPRFLEFEKWWGAPVLLDRDEIQLIIDGLFVGNRLSAARLRTSEGLRIDLRNIKSPILIFCSQGDDITPPPQALGWITDLYKSDKEIVTAGQTIIYCLHQKIGHLGIFVASSVATKEHSKFISNIDTIETLPPGLYEAVFVQKTESVEHADLATGDYVLRFENRTLDDIRKIGTNSPEDDRRFLTVKRVSENNLSLYETYVSPWVRAFVTEQLAEFIRQTHPIRVRFNMFSDRNPLMANVAKFAEMAKANRRPASKDNFFWKIQEIISDNVIAALDRYKKCRDSLEEHVFLEIYGAKILQSSLGLNKKMVYSKSAGRDLDRERDIEQRIQELMLMAGEGGLPEALTRAFLYVVRGGGGFDEREFKMLKQLCDASTTLPKMSNAELKALLRQQHEILVLDEQNAIRAISRLLDNSTEAAAQESLSAIHTVIKAHGSFTSEEKRRLQELETYFVPSHTTPRRRKTDIEAFGGTAS